MQTRTLMALKRTSLWAIFFSLPLLAVAYYKFNYAATSELESYGEVKPFYFVTPTGGGISNHSLRNHVNLIAYLPSGAAATGAALPTLEAIAAWMDSNLRTGDKAAAKPYRLLILNSSPTAIGATAPWEEINAVSEADLRAFLPEPLSLQEPQLVVVDHEGELRAHFALTQASMEPLERVTSKINFNHYLNDYLSKRTFFGPKRTYK